MDTAERAGSAREASAWARNPKKSLASASFTCALLTAPAPATKSDLNPVSVSFPAPFSQTPSPFPLPPRAPSPLVPPERVNLSCG